MRAEDVQRERLAQLQERRAAFLAFVERRLGDRARAEDLLQDAAVRSLGALPSLPTHVPVVPWFYRVLRNAIIDERRRSGAASRGLEHFGALQAQSEEASERAPRACACLHQVRKRLAPAYAEVLERVELAGVPLGEWAAEVGITAGNAAVRAHRARAAMGRALAVHCGACAAEESCRDCVC